MRTVLGSIEKSLDRLGKVRSSVTLPSLSATQRTFRTETKSPPRKKKQSRSKSTRSSKSQGSPLISNQDQFFKSELAKVWDLLYAEKTKRQSLYAKYKGLKLATKPLLAALQCKSLPEATKAVETLAPLLMTLPSDETPTKIHIVDESPTPKTRPSSPTP